MVSVPNFLYCYLLGAGRKKEVSNMKRFLAYKILVFLIMLAFVSCAHRPTGSLSSGNRSDKPAVSLKFNENVIYGVYQDKNGEKKVLTIDIAGSRKINSKAASLSGQILVSKSGKIVREIPVKMVATCDGSSIITIKGSTQSGKPFSSRATLDDKQQLLLSSFNAGFDLMTE